MDPLAFRTIVGAMHADQRSQMEMIVREGSRGKSQDDSSDDDDEDENNGTRRGQKGMKREQPSIALKMDF